MRTRTEQRVSERGRGREKGRWEVITLTAPVEETQVCLTGSCFPFVSVLWAIEHGELQIEFRVRGQLATSLLVYGLNAPCME